MTSTNTSNFRMAQVDGELTRLSRSVGAYNRVVALITDQCLLLERDKEALYELEVAAVACRLNLAQVITDLRAAWLACFPPPATTTTETP